MNILDEFDRAVAAVAGNRRTVAWAGGSPPGEPLDGDPAPVPARR